MHIPPKTLSATIKEFATIYSHKQSSFSFPISCEIFNIQQTIKLYTCASAPSICPCFDGFELDT